jgi:hypothetical protein
MKRKIEIVTGPNDSATQESNPEELYFTNQINSVHDLRKVLRDNPESELYIVNRLFTDEVFFTRIIKNEQCLELAFEYLPRYKSAMSTKFLTDINFINWNLNNRSYAFLDKVFTLLPECMEYISNKFLTDPEVLDYIIIENLFVLENCTIFPAASFCISNKCINDSVFLERFLPNIASLEKFLKILPNLAEHLLKKLSTDKVFFNRMMDIEENRECFKIITRILPTSKNYISNKLLTDSDFFKSTFRNGFCVEHVIKALPSCSDYILKKLLTDSDFFRIIVKDDYYLEQISNIFLEHELLLQLHHNLLNEKNPKGLFIICQRIEEAVKQGKLSWQSLELISACVEKAVNSPVIKGDESGCSKLLICLYDLLSDEIFEVTSFSPLGGDRLLLISFTELALEEELQRISTANNSAPILIKQGDNYSIFGNTDGQNWKVTALDNEIAEKFASSFSDNKTTQWLDYNFSTKELYIDIILKKAHTSPNKNIQNLKHHGLFANTNNLATRLHTREIIPSCLNNNLPFSFI